MEYSKQINNLVPSPTLVINEQVQEMRNMGESIIQLGFGESPFPVPLQVVASLQQHAHKKSYYPTVGLDELRSQVAKFLTHLFFISTKKSQVIIGPGSKELIFDLLMVLDGLLLLPQPSWVSYVPQASLAQKSTFFFPTRPVDNLLLTASVFKDHLIRNELDNSIQKILILNYPNNPTGASYNGMQLYELAKVCRQYNIIVIADEIYGLLTFDRHHESLVTYYPEKTILTTGLSKFLSLGGYRVGVARIPTDNHTLLSALRTIGSETWSSVSAPIQHAAVTAFDVGPTIQYIPKVVHIHKTISEYVYSALTSNTQLWIPKPKGSYYLFPSFATYQENLANFDIYNSEQLALWLLHEYKLATLPGTPFGMPSENLYLRLALVDYDGQRILQHYQDVTAKSLPEFVPNIVTATQRIIHACKRLEKNVIQHFNPPVVNQPALAVS